MIDHVDATLKEWRRSSFVWGQTDCALSVAAHIDRVNGTAGGQIARFRGTYADELEAAIIRDEQGGLDALFDSLGLERTEQPERGDVVLCATVYGDIIAGLCTGEGVAIRRERGVAEVGKRYVRIVAAWKVS